MEKEEE
jgi:26S proteasome regulatory subunit N1